jgi:hypothetical protein
MLAIVASANQSAHAKPMTYGCDTPADHFSAIEQKVSLADFSIQTKIQPNEFRKGEFSPLAQIYFQSTDEKNRWAVKVIALGHKEKSALVMLDVTRDGKDKEWFPVGAVKLGEQLPISISITGGSKIKFNIGGLEGNPELNLGADATLNIICSTGDFVFSDLDWSEK